MALTLGDNFSYQGAKPLDSRIKYETIAAMKAVEDSTMYEGCIGYCVATEKTYQWKSTNTVDSTTGKWREYSGGASSVSDLSDVDLISPSDGQILKYDATNHKWINNNESVPDFDDLTNRPTALTTFTPPAFPSVFGSKVCSYEPIGSILFYAGHSAPENYLACDGTVYNIGEYKELAKWIEAEYEAVNYFGGDGTSTFAVPDWQGEFFRAAGTNSHTNQGSGAAVGVHQDASYVNSLSESAYLYSTKTDGSSQNYDSTITGITRRYIGSPSTDGGGDKVTTRPTNTSLLVCIKARADEKYQNIYDGNERVVGEWFGKKLYQKVVDLSSITISFSNPVTILTGVDEVVDYRIKRERGIMFLYDGVDSRNQTYIQNSSGDIQIGAWSSSYDYGNCEWGIFVYTKTTD